MGGEWPRAARLDAGGLVEAVHARTDLRLQLLGPLPGGQVGAALVALPSGRRAVLSCWPGALGARAPIVGGIVDRLRARGYPAPAYLAVVDCGGVTAVLQELVDGGPAREVGEGLAASLLELNRRQRGALPEAGGSVADLYLDRDGPGYCLHGPLRHHDARTAALLDRVEEVGRAAPPGVFTGADAVHGDFHPGNVLVRASSPDRIAGVVDWTGAQAGDCGLDLVTLGFALDHDSAPPRVRDLVRGRIAADVGAGALLAFTAHMALRQVDWAIRHHGPEATRRWVQVAEDRLTRAARQAH